MPELQDHTHAAHLWPTAQHSDLAPGLWAFLASVSIVRLIKSLWVDRSKIWHNSSCPYLIFIACSEVKAHAKFFDGWNSRSFYFHMQNAHVKYAKVSTIRKFPAIRYLVWSGLCSAYTQPESMVYVTGFAKTRHVARTRKWRNARF